MINQFRWRQSPKPMAVPVEEIQNGIRNGVRKIKHRQPTTAWPSRRRPVRLAAKDPPTSPRHFKQAARATMKKVWP